MKKYSLLTIFIIFTMQHSVSLGVIQGYSDTEENAQCERGNGDQRKHVLPDLSETFNNFKIFCASTTVTSFYCFKNGFYTAVFCRLFVGGSQARLGIFGLGLSSGLYQAFNNTKKEATLGRQIAQWGGFAFTAAFVSTAILGGVFACAESIGK